MSRSDWTTPDLSAASARWNQTDSSMNEEPFSRSARRRFGVVVFVAFVGAPVGASVKVGTPVAVGAKEGAVHGCLLFLGSFVWGVPVWARRVRGP